MKNVSGIEIPITTDESIPELGYGKIVARPEGFYRKDSDGNLHKLLEDEDVPPSSQLDLPLVADENILAYKVVRANSLGKAVYASADNLSDANKVLGVAINSALTADTVNVRAEGFLENPYWNFTPNQNLFLGLNGEITSSPSIGAFSNTIGYALTTTKIFIKIGRSIIRG